MSAGSGALGWFVEWDAELDLDLPAGDADLLDEQAQQGLFLREVEVVDAGADACGEVVDASPHVVVAGQFLALAGQGFAALGEVSATVLDFGVAALQFGEVDQSGLVEVEESAVLGVGGVVSSGEPGQFGLEQFVVGCWCQGGEGVLAGEQQVGAQEHLTELVEDEGVEGFGANVAFRAAVFGSAARTGSWLRQ